MMLLGWWIFLYAFIVFPHQYVVLNVQLYNVCLRWALPAAEHLAPRGPGTCGLDQRVRMAVVLSALLRGAVIYSVGSQFLDRAVMAGNYYSGSLYDVPLIGTGRVDGGGSYIGARMGHAKPRVQLGPPMEEGCSSTRHAGFALVAGARRVDGAARQIACCRRVYFRLFAVLVAMLVLGGFVFLRQYFQDQALIALLQESRRGYESQKRLQSQLVQKEKLASLGNLVAGAAARNQPPARPPS